MRERLRRLCLRFQMELRILRLFFLDMSEPEDAKTPEQMLAEIKKRASEITELT